MDVWVDAQVGVCVGGWMFERIVGCMGGLGEGMDLMGGLGREDELTDE